MLYTKLIEEKLVVNFHDPWFSSDVEFHGVEAYGVLLWSQEDILNLRWELTKS